MNFLIIHSIAKILLLGPIVFLLYRQFFRIPIEKIRFWTYMIILGAIYIHGFKYYAQTIFREPLRVHFDPTQVGFPLVRSYKPILLPKTQYYVKIGSAKIGKNGDPRESNQWPGARDREIIIEKEDPTSSCSFGKIGRWCNDITFFSIENFDDQRIVTFRINDPPPDEVNYLGFSIGIPGYDDKGITFNLNIFLEFFFMYGGAFMIWLIIWTSSRVLQIGMDIRNRP